MGHHAQHVSRVVDDASDGSHGSVWTPPLVGISRTTDVSEYHAALALQCMECFRVRGVTSITVGNGDPQDGAALVPVGKEGFVVFHPELDRLAHELEARIAEQGARQQPGLAHDLEPVAEADHRAASFGKRDDVLHHGAESGNRPGPQVVAVAEAARQDDHVALLQVVILVPQVHRFLAQCIDDGVIGVVVAVGARKGDDAELHGAAPSTLAISKSSVTGLESRRSHISRVERSAAAASEASTSTMTCRPMWTSWTALKPRECRASATVLPCGSRMPRRGVM